MIGAVFTMAFSGLASAGILASVGAGAAAGAAAGSAAALAGTSVTSSSSVTTTSSVLASSPSMPSRGAMSCIMVMMKNEIETMVAQVLQLPLVRQLTLYTASAPERARTVASKTRDR